VIAGTQCIIGRLDSEYMLDRRVILVVWCCKGMVETQEVTFFRAVCGCFWSSHASSLHNTIFHFLFVDLY